MLTTTRALPMNSSAPPIASLVSSSCESHGYAPKKFIVVRLAPMWKCTGISSAAHASHTGSHARFARSGEPRSCGSDVRLTPRRPRLRGPLDLAHARVDVPRREDRHRQQPVARLRLQLGVGVVEDLDAEVAQLRILDEVAERLAAEADHAREDDLRPDADLVEQLHPRVGVVTGCVALLDLPLVEALERATLLAVLVDDTARARAAEHDVAFDDPGRRAVDLRRRAGRGP